MRRRLMMAALFLLVSASLAPSQSTAPAPLGPPPSIDLSSILNAVTYTVNGISSHDAAIQNIWSKQVSDEADIAALKAQAPIPGPPGPEGPQGLPGTPTNMLGVIVVPSSLAFSSAINTTSAAQYVLVYNQTSAAVSLSAASYSGPFLAPGGGNCGSLTSLPAGQSCAYSVAFRTSSTGQKSGALALNVGGIAVGVSLSGTGQ